MIESRLKQAAKQLTSTEKNVAGIAEETGFESSAYDIVAHVHDEVILEVPKGSTTVDAVCGIMNQNPSWAERLPLSSAGYVGEKFYFKD